VASAPDCPWAHRTFKRAHTVTAGEYVWVVGAGGGVELSRVVGVGEHLGKGLFNPYTVNGATVMNGVLRCHN
jgi:hypothetical protein